jgi:hypothetical protein
MPDDIFTPASVITKLFGQVPQSLPKTSATIDDAKRNQIVKQDQQKALDDRDKMSYGEQFLRGLFAGPTSALLDMTKHVTTGGMDDENPAYPRNPDGWNPYNVGLDVGSLGLNLLMPSGHGDTEVAGVPFPKGKTIYHGSPNAGKIAKEGFDMTRHDPHDTLGWMIHAADDPHYANSYAEGLKSSVAGRPGGVLPLTSNAENMLDAFAPTSEDVARLVSGVGDNVDRYGTSKRKTLIDAWKKGDTAVTRGHPIRDVLNYMTPEEFSKTGFDAIKYPDINNVSYAFPDPLKTIGKYTGEPVGGKSVLHTGPFEEIPLGEDKGVMLTKPQGKTATNYHMGIAKKFIETNDDIDMKYNYVNKLFKGNKISAKEHDELLDHISDVHDIDDPNNIGYIPMSINGWNMMEDKDLATIENNAKKYGISIDKTKTAPYDIVDQINKAKKSAVQVPPKKDDDPYGFKLYNATQPQTHSMPDDGGLGWDWTGMPNSAKKTAEQKAQELDDIFNNIDYGDVSDPNKIPKGSNYVNTHITNAEGKKLVELSKVQGIGTLDDDYDTLLKKLFEHSNTNSKYWHPKDKNTIATIAEKYKVKPNESPLDQGTTDWMGNPKGDNPKHDVDFIDPEYQKYMDAKAKEQPTTNKYNSQDTLNVTNIAEKLGINYHKFNMPELIDHLIGQKGALDSNEFNYLYDLKHPPIGTPTKLNDQAAKIAKSPWKTVMNIGHELGIVKDGAPWEELVKAIKEHPDYKSNSMLQAKMPKDLSSLGITLDPEHNVIGKNASSHDIDYIHAIANMLKMDHTKYSTVDELLKSLLAQSKNTSSMQHKHLQSIADKHGIK